MSQPIKLEKSVPILSPLYQEDFPVNLSVAPDLGEDRRITAISGRKCLESLERSDPLGLLLRMLLTSSIWHSMIFRLTWKLSATKLSRLYFRLGASALSTKDNAALPWPTPNAGGGTGYMSGSKSDMWRPTLAMAVRMCPTGNPPLLTAEELRGTSGQSRVSRELALKKYPPIAGEMNPEWVEWLMGFPVGWTDVEC